MVDMWVTQNDSHSRYLELVNMVNIFLQLYIEGVLSGGKPYIAFHPELGVPIGIFNTKHEPNYESRVRGIKKMGVLGNKKSLKYARLLNIKNPLPSFFKDDYEKESKEEVIKLLKEQIELNEEIRKGQNRINADLMDNAQQWKGISEYMKGSSNVMAAYGNMVINAGQRMATFVVDTRKQYETSEKMAESFKKASLNMGLTVGQSKAMSETFKNAVPYAERLGLHAADLEEIYSSLASSSGRIQFLSTDELEKLTMMSKAFKLSTQEAGEMADRFQLMGINIQKSYEVLEESFQESRKLGLNSQKVMDVLQSNFASMQRMSFKGGVKAMTQMAKLAVDMRMDVSDMLGMADKFYNPEAAIEAAAELQLMGGDIAAAFGDPFEVMYLARNKPEELAQKVADMTENMVTFNEETGQYDLPAEARQQLTFMADKLGLAKDNVIDMAFQTSKLKDVKNAFGGSTMFTEDEQSAIAQMATFDKNTGWTVTVGDEELGLDDSKLKDAVESGMLIAKGDDEPLEKMVDASFTTNELLQNILSEFEAGVSISTDFYEIGERLLEDSTKQLSEGSKQIIKTVNEEVKKGMSGESNNKLYDIFDEKKQEELGARMAKSLEKTFDFVDAIIKGESGDGLLDSLKDFQDYIDKMITKGSGNTIPGSGGNKGDIDFSSITDPAECTTKGGKMVGGRCVAKTGDLISYPGKSRTVTGDFGEFALDDRDMLFAGDPKKMGGKDNNTSSEMKIGGTATVNVNIKTDNPSLDLSQHTDVIARTVTKILTNGSQPDGDRLPQEGGANVLQSI
jgi:hypothetical protein